MARASIKSILATASADWQQIRDDLSELQQQINRRCRPKRYALFCPQASAKSAALITAMSQLMGNLAELAADEGDPKHSEPLLSQQSIRLHKALRQTLGDIRLAKDRIKQKFFNKKTRADQDMGRLLLSKLEATEKKCRVFSSKLNMLIPYHLVTMKQQLEGSTYPDSSLGKLMADADFDTVAMKKPLSLGEPIRSRHSRAASA